MPPTGSPYGRAERGAWGMKPIDRPRVRVLSGSDAERGGWVTPAQSGLQRYDAVLDPHCTVFRTPTWEQHYRMMRLSEAEKNRWNERAQTFLPPLPNRTAQSRIPVSATPHFDPLAPANNIKVYAPGIQFPPLFDAVSVAASYGGEGPAPSVARQAGGRRDNRMAFTYPASVKLAVAVGPDGTMSYSAYPVSNTAPADPYNPHANAQPMYPPQQYYPAAVVAGSVRPPAKVNAMGGTRHPATVAGAGAGQPRLVAAPPPVRSESAERGQARPGMGPQAQAARAVAAAEQRREEEEAAAAAAAAEAAAREAAGRPMVVCGPSGVGKGTLIQRLMGERPDAFGFAVSHTTRGPRPGEVHGQHYYFARREDMEAAVAAGAFLESAEVHGNLYGTSFDAIRAVLASGRVCVLDIDVQGARQVKAAAERGEVPRPLFVFIAPPSLAELEMRLRGRGTETEEKVALRLKNARAEMEFLEQNPTFFDRVVVNDELEIAYAEFEGLASALARGELGDEEAAPPTTASRAEAAAAREAAEAAVAEAARLAGEGPPSAG